MTRFLPPTNINRIQRPFFACSAITAPGYRYNHPPYSATPRARSSYISRQHLLQPHKQTWLYIPQHDQTIPHHIRDPQPERHKTGSLPLRLIPNQILQHHDRDTPRQPTRHQRKPKEQHQPRLPRHAGPRVREAIRGKSGLLDRVDDQHAERGADQWDPVNEGDVEEGGVEGRVRVGGGVDEEEEAEGELDRGLAMGIYCMWGRGEGGGWSRTSAPDR